MRTTTLLGLQVILVWATVSPAAGQTRSIDAHLFRPALYSRGIFGVDQAGPTNPWQPGFGVYFNHESSPLHLTFPQNPCPTTGCLGRQDIISTAEVFNLQAQLALTRWLELAIDFPLARQSYAGNPSQDINEGFELLTADDLYTNIPAPAVTPLDMRAGVRVNFLNTRQGISAAVSIEGTVPFGDEQYFSGIDGATFHPRLIASLARGPIALAANLGYRVRPQSVLTWNDPNTTEGAIPLVSIDDELTYGVGAVYQFHSIVGVGVEFTGAVPVLGGGTYQIEVSRRLESDVTKCPAGTPAGSRCEIVTTRQVDLPRADNVGELLGGAIFAPFTGVKIAVGGGAGIAGDMRKVGYRIFSGISWMPGAETAIAGARDRDKDGVPDSKDECPDQAEDKDGYRDDDGCPDLDNDADGVADAQDRCPNEPEDRDGYKDEDGCPDADNDDDGVADAQDKCPDQAEDKDRFQDEDGCPDPDNDGDSIADAKDQCPNEAETMNGYQDEDGCPDTGPTPVRAGKLDLPERIRFKPGSATLETVSNRVLDEIAKRIVENPQTGKIRIEGHTDNTGSAATNQRVSEERANSVKEYLIRKGVPADRLETVGYGASRSVSDNSTAAGREKNRRVEFIVIQLKEGKAP